MKKIYKIKIIFIMVCLLSSCSKVVLKSEADSETDLSTIKTFYVKTFASDKFKVDKKIASTLNNLGFKATYGSADKPVEPVDAIITYEDRWMWDISMYMLEIDIKLHEPETNFIFASGRSFRTSLARKSAEYMIEEVFRDLFENKVLLPEKKKENSPENNED